MRKDLWRFDDLTWAIQWLMGAAREKQRPLKADDIGFVEIGRFDLGNLIAHGKGKIATIKSR